MKSDSIKSAAPVKAKAAKSASVFDKLDPNVHAHRLQQRRKSIKLGKNTAGYTEYIKQVPRKKRMKRSMKHPATPDFTLDIPTKRWMGLVKAWRRALHQYDPPDLAQAFAAEAAAPAVNTPTAGDVQTRELVQARSMLVDVTPEVSRADKLLNQWDEQAAGDDDGDDLEDVFLDDSDDEML